MNIGHFVNILRGDGSPSTQLAGHLSERDRARFSSAVSSDLCLSWAQHKSARGEQDWLLLRQQRTDFRCVLRRESHGTTLIDSDLDSQASEHDRYPIKTAPSSSQTTRLRHRRTDAEAAQTGSHEACGRNNKPNRISQRLGMIPMQTESGPEGARGH